MATTKADLALQIDKAWAIEPHTAQGYLAVLESTPAAFGEVDHRPQMATKSEVEEAITERAVKSGGIVTLNITGPMTKRASSMSSLFGGSATSVIRKLVQECERNDAVKGVFLVIDSPGGQVSGTEQLAADVRSLSVKKPVMAFVSDMCCSAAYWVASQCDSIIAEPMATVGSIGTYAVAYDVSEYYEQRGIQALLFTTGAFKGAFAEGVKVSDEQIAEYQAYVNGLQVFFASAVAMGRGLTPEQISSVADGRVWVGAEAESVGLIDGVASESEAYEMLLLMVNPKSGGSIEARAVEAKEEQIMDQEQGKGKVSFFDRVLGRVDAGNGAAAPGSVTKEDAAAEIAGLQSQLQAKSAEVHNALLGRLETEAKSFAEKAKREGRVSGPAEEERVAHAYAKAVLADNPGGLSLNESGELVSGDLTEALVSMIKGRAPMIMTTDQLPAITNDRGVHVLPSTKAPALRDKIDEFMGLTPLGQQALALRGGQN